MSDGYGYGYSGYGYSGYGYSGYGYSGGGYSGGGDSGYGFSGGGSAAAYFGGDDTNNDDANEEELEEVTVSANRPQGTQYNISFWISSGATGGNFGNPSLPAVAGGVATKVATPSEYSTVPTTTIESKIAHSTTMQALFQSMYSASNPTSNTSSNRQEYGVWIGYNSTTGQFSTIAIAPPAKSASGINSELPIGAPPSWSGGYYTVALAHTHPYDNYVPTYNGSSVVYGYAQPSQQDINIANNDGIDGIVIGTQGEYYFGNHK